MKHKLKTILLALLSVTLFFGLTAPALAVEEDLVGVPIVVYGANLTDDEIEKVKELLDVEDLEDTREYTVTGQDYFDYIGGSASSNMFSSAKIIGEDEGKGITIHIVTPENITKVTSEMYDNALLTAGGEQASVDVDSPRPVTRHSALTGIYKAYDAEGVQLDQDRMEVASEELEVATDLAEKEGMSQEKVSELLAEIKKAISEKNPATREDIERNIKEEYEKFEINLSEVDLQKLIDLFEKMRSINIDFDKVKEQLEDLTSKVKDKMDELGLDEGFWKKVANFFGDLFKSVG